LHTGGPVSGISRRLLVATSLSLTVFLALALIAATHPVSDLDRQTRALVHLIRIPVLDRGDEETRGARRYLGSDPADRVRRRDRGARERSLGPDPAAPDGRYRRLA